LFVEEPLDLVNSLDILAAIETVAGRSLHWLERGNFLFPVAKHEGLNAREAADLADPE
jgi:hypothetical protein